MKKYVVDEALCSGQGRCYAVAPEIFGQDSDGYNKDIGRVVQIPPGLEDAVDDGVGVCPEQAIRVFADRS